MWSSFCSLLFLPSIFGTPKGRLRVRTMSFWAPYKGHATAKRFEEYRAPIHPMDTEGVTIESYSLELQRFLEDQFGSVLKSRPPAFSEETKRGPPHRPTWSAEEEFGGAHNPRPTWSAEEEFVVARSTNGTLLGCGHVVSRPPLFEGHPIYPTDWLCVAKDHRKTGLTSRILQVGYSYLRSKGVHTCLYLKEGAPMRIPMPPLYSSTYLYRRTDHLKASLSPCKAAPIRPGKAARLMNLIRQVRPTTFILHSEDLPNQTWRFWKKGLSWILMGFQDAYQTYQGGTVGTLSAFFSAGPSLVGVWEALVDSAPFDWIWADQAFVKGHRSLWSSDGPFHWYTYQWSTCIALSDQYCLMV